MIDILNITLIQTDIVWEDIALNLEKYSLKISEISEKTDIIVLPEMFATGFSMNPEQFAESHGGRIFRQMQKWAAEKTSAVVGTIITQENGQYFNRLIWMQADGTHYQYDKKHLFSFAGENQHYTAGNSKLIIDYKGWRIRPLICYDLRFPVWSRNRNDYDLLIYTANWPERRKHAWKTLLQARAIENQCYTVGVNRVGKDANGIDHSGDSVIIDSAGAILSDIPAGKENITTLSISLREQNDFRNKFAFWKDADNFEFC